MLKKQKTVKVSVAIVILFTFVFGFFQINKSIVSTYQSFLKSVSYPSGVQADVNEAVNRNKETTEEEQEQDKRSILEVLFIISGAVVFYSMFHLFEAMTLMATMGVFFSLKNNYSKNIKLRAKMRCYMVWCVKIISPVEKCIQRRADEYEINPLKRVLREKTPRFVLGQNAGFFMDK